MDYEAVRTRLLHPANRGNCRDLSSPPHEPGVYGLFARDGQDDAFEDLGLGRSEHRLLYVGVATDRLSKRYHPAETSSRRSSPRLSFGALLYRKLRLRMAQKPPDARAHWEFEPDGERRLSHWMMSHLAYACVPLPAGEARIAEPVLIGELMPPMNIKLIGSADRSRLIAARDHCKRMARGGAVAKKGTVRIKADLHGEVAERLDELAAIREVEVQDLVVEAVRFLLDRDE